MCAQREHALRYKRFPDESYQWLRDDTEEDLVGADWHQDAIRALSGGLRDLADARGWPWHVGDQLTLVACKPNGKVWRPSPDIMIHPQAGPARREEIAIKDEGVPALIIEVASRSTWKKDVDTRTGKAFGYLFLRVPEYLVFDPMGTFLREQCRGWQREGEEIRPWLPGPDGLYRSQSLGISFVPDGNLLRVYDPQGNPVPYPYENAQMAQLARGLQQEVAELRAELDRLRRQDGPAGE